jgi:hypothetical protein
MISPREDYYCRIFITTLATIGYLKNPQRILNPAFVVLYLTDLRFALRVPQ